MPGCNARSVRQYIKSVLLLLSYHRAFHLGEQITPLTEAVNEVELSFKNLTIGIVGVGYVGREVESLARELGFGRILLCDPPRAEREGSKAFCSLKDITAQADVITLHLPLTREGTPHPTYHLIDEEVFQTIRPQTVLINSGRGETVDNSALHHALVTGRLRAAVIDTWENEPAIDRKLLDSVFIATPHIAGYSADGKACGTRMALLAVARHFGLPETPFLKIVPPEVPAEYAYYPQGTARHLSTALRYYDPTRDDLALRSCPENFERLRGDYPLRREEP